MNGGDAYAVRVASASDDVRIDRFYDRLSDKSRYLRFFTPFRSAHHAPHDLPPEATHIVLVAEKGGEIIGTGELIRMHAQAPSAEVAFAVLDAWQHHGIATLMLAKLVDEARRLGVQTLTAQVLAANHSMLEVLREAGLPMIKRLEQGVYDVSLRLSPPS